MNGSDLDRLIEAVVPLLRAECPQLPDPFFPAHLPVAIVDAVFAVPPTCETQPPPVFGERYCRWFELERTRTDPFRLPSPDAQQTLGDLIAHQEALGFDALEEDPRYPRSFSRNGGHARGVCR